MGKKENRPVACAASGTASTCDYDSTFVSAGQDMTENGLCQVIVGNLPTSFFPYDIFSVFGYAK